ncbi:hypothetical protein PSH28_11125 [Pseudomonas resinovorans]|uniref:hypothetical protein n=1 Tax=Metapseudomonas resinovorans TaxID=53412 RepID=UPI00237F8BAD|nr:hypothetical protein [Pseudomonas resinovorans]MDE3737150.1 hypothetical protein [Pseudomonas resinovorans]
MQQLAAQEGKPELDQVKQIYPLSVSTPASGGAPAYPNGYIKYENSAAPKPPRHRSPHWKNCAKLNITLPNRKSTSMKDSKLQDICGSKIIDATLTIDDAGISFENGARLAIYNHYELIGDLPNHAKSLIGKSINRVSEDNYTISITIEGNITIKINMRDDGYTGPEAIQLIISKQEIIIWS